ncbi:MAG TPA: dethiobiotin synthase [Acidiphilium sp.]|nr:dethiobiotin synthase [Acidiphilium sp.]HQU24909.1 dethiobiotin synthase [Acidiphilium sp.]
MTSFNMMNHYFVTSTGTDMGKTYVTAAMIRALRAQGRMAHAIKPLASGYDAAQAATSDAGMLLAAMGRAVSDEAIAAICPWRFAAPISPDMAAAREGKAIDMAAVIGFCQAAMAAAPGHLFIEGVGGAMVPLDAARTVRDWIAALGVSAVVIVGNYLGTISHTLCTLEALAAAQIAVAAVVVNEQGEGPVPVAETIAALRQHQGGLACPIVAVDAPGWLEWIGEQRPERD